MQIFILISFLIGFLIDRICYFEIVLQALVVQLIFFDQLKIKRTAGFLLRMVGVPC